MPQNEKGRQNGDPIPNVVLEDNSDLNTEPRRFQAPLIVQRDLDGWFDVLNGDQIAGPFPTIAFAMQIATGEKPANIRNDVGGKFRRFRVVRAISQTNSSTAFNATDRDAIQASRIVRLYAVTFATAATIARLAYAVAR